MASLERLASGSEHLSLTGSRIAAYSGGVRMRTWSELVDDWILFPVNDVAMEEGWRAGIGIDRSSDRAIYDLITPRGAQ